MSTPQPQMVRGGVSFRVGEALVDSLGILTRHFFTFLIPSALGNAPGLYFNWLFAQEGGHLSVYSWLGIFSEHFIDSVCQAAVVFATFQSLRGRPVKLLESCARAASRLIPVVATSLLCSLIELIGFLLLLVPGYIATMALFVALPACIVERLGPFRSVSRSSDLTRGHRWGIFGVVLVVGIGNLIVSYVLGRAGGGDITTFAWVTYAWTTILTAYTSVLTTVIYHGLRVDKEGIDINQIAAVFD